MELTISIPEDVEQGIQEEADRRGIEPDEIVAEALRQRFAHERREEAIALLTRLGADTAGGADDPAGAAEWRTLQAALDEDRPSGRPLFPDAAR